MKTPQQLADWYAALSPHSLRELGDYYAPEASFKDPFNEVRGVAAIQHIFEHMFATTVAPRFVILDCLSQGEQTFMRWHFHFGIQYGKRLREYTVEGGTHFRFAADGRVLVHRDYWDAAEELWQKLPVLGGITAWLRKKFAVKAAPKN